MGNNHPYVLEVESALTKFSQNEVDLGEPLTSIGRDLARGTIAAIEIGAERAGNCPLLYLGQSFISGSLGRRTQEKPLDDVDVYLVLEAPVLHGSERGRPYPLTSQCTRSATSLIDDPTLSCIGNISANAVLDRFVEYLPQWFPETETGKGRAGKTCWVKQGPVNIDLSPVIWFRSEVGAIDEYWMPAGGGNIQP